MIASNTSGANGERRATMPDPSSRPRQRGRRQRSLGSDRDLLDDRELLQRLQDRYDQVAASDPTAQHLRTTDRTPSELAELVLGVLPATAGRQ
jgi:hypothetical protein